MEKLKKILIILCLTLVSSIGFVGCSFLNTTLDTPNITMDKENMEISWTDVENADYYEIYMDDKIVDTLKDDNSLSYVFNFSSLVADENLHSFKVRAVSENELYASSSYTRLLNYIGNISVDTTEDKFDIEYSSTYSPKNVTISSDLVQWNEVTGVDEYYIGIYTTSNGLEYFTTDKNFIVLSSIDIQECAAVRVGVKKSNENTLFLNQNILYYSPDSSEEFTKEFYLFDGQINDMYVTTVEELDNLVYYNFIYRNQDYTFRADKKIQNQIISIYKNNDDFSGTTLADYVKYATNFSFSKFIETMDYEYTMSGRANVINSTADYVDVTVQISFKGVKECDTTIKPEEENILVQDKSISNPYYQVYDGDFIGTRLELAVDNWFLSTVVETSEQLYWAVENQIQPIFVDTNCKAYKIYNQALSVLQNEIIKPGMTDYEKALSIFDWIEYNTLYDYTPGQSEKTYNSSTGSWEFTGKFLYGNKKLDAITLIPSYYLEGVFETGYAVCDGFSKAYSLMCNMIGIECVRIGGDIYENGIHQGEHAWNKVKINGVFYVCDITWTPLYGNVQVDEEIKKAEYLSHHYFLVSDNYISTTHEQFEYRDKYETAYYASPSMYGFYTSSMGTYYTSESDTTGIKVDRLITSDEDFEYTFRYLLNNKIENIELVLELNYYQEYSLNDTNILKSSKIKCQYLTFTYSQYTIFYGNYNADKGVVLFMKLVNLIDDTSTTDGEDDIVELIQHLNSTDSDSKFRTYDIWIDEILLESYLPDDATTSEQYQLAIQNWYNNLILNVYNNTNIGGLDYTNFVIEFNLDANNGQPIEYSLNDTINRAFICTFKLLNE